MSLLMALVPICLLLGNPETAHAQQAIRQPQLAVLDFANDSSYGGPDVGRTAADALVVELSESGKYDVLDRSEVNQGLNNLGLTPPLDTIDIQRLGKQLQADAIVTGEVLAVSRADSGKQVQAVVVVRMTDANNGELINGSLARGTSTPRDGTVADDDMLVNEAIGKAMFAAVRQMTNYNLPNAAVLTNEGPDTVLLNKGSRDGLTVGLSMIVGRGDQTVGEIKVTDVEPDESVATVTDQGIGIKPQDVAHGIFSLPEYSVRGNTVVTDTDISSGAAVQAQKHSSFAGIGGIILAVFAAALLLALVNRGSSSDSAGGGAIGGVIAQAGYGPELGLPYNSTSTLAGGGDGDSYAIRITWSTGNLNPRDVLGYNIYRDDYQPFVYSPTNTNSTVGTTGTTTTTTTAGTTTTGTTGDFFTFGAGPVASVSPAVRTCQDTGVPRSLVFPFVVHLGGFGTTGTGGTTTAGTTGTTGVTASTGTTGQVGGGLNLGALGYGTDLNVPGVALGIPHQYEVTAVYQVTLAGQGGAATTTNGSTVGTTSGQVTTIAYEETAISGSGSAVGLATPIVPPDPTNSITDTIEVNEELAFEENNVNLSSATFSVPTVFGGDTYVIEVATQANFSNKIVSDTMHTIRTGGQTVVFTFGGNPNLNIRSRFPTLSAGSDVYYRVGIRDSADNPGPLVNGGINPNPTVLSNGSSYIYSTIGFFTGS
jgi:hypothetical protein